MPSSRTTGPCMSPQLTESLPPQRGIPTRLGYTAMFLPISWFIGYMLGQTSQLNEHHPDSSQYNPDHLKHSLQEHKRCGEEHQKCLHQGWGLFFRRKVTSRRPVMKLRPFQPVTRWADRVWRRDYACFGVGILRLRWMENSNLRDSRKDRWAFGRLKIAHCSLEG